MKRRFSYTSADVAGGVIARLKVEY